jgi:hypothetical protein
MDASVGYPAVQVFINNLPDAGEYISARRCPSQRSVID